MKYIYRVDKKVFGIVSFFGLALLFSCNPNGNSSETKVEEKRNQEKLNETETIDFKGKLESGESFKLPSVSGCNFDKEVRLLGDFLNAPSQRELIQVSEILKYSGLPSNFKIYKTANSIKNAYATVLEGQRLIVFDEDMLREVDDRDSQKYWASMSILAHEVGHHLSGHILDGKGSNHTSEMEADKFAGYVLFKMGAKLEEATFAFQQLGSEFDSPTHPSKYKRIEFIKEGWNEANRQRMMAALPPSIDDEFEDEAQRFYPDQILDTDEYEWLYIDRAGEYTLIHENEGVILKERKLQDFFIYEIMMTSMKEDHEYLQPDGVYEFGMNNPIDAFNPMHHLKRGAFTEIVMQPGRKIKFTLSSQGNQANYVITKVEVIPRIE